MNFIRCGIDWEIGFGSTSQVVDAVLGEISVLRPVSEGNTRKLLEVINVVEQACLDIKEE